MAKEERLKITDRTILRMHPMYGGDGEALAANLQELDFAAADAESREHQRLERNRIRVAQEKAAKQQEERQRRVAIERDEEAREKSALLKQEYKRMYLNTGQMTSEEFDREWPALKREHLRRQVDAQEQAQAALPIYANLI
jgi:hypothetical protein